MPYNQEELPIIRVKHSDADLGRFQTGFNLATVWASGLSHQPIEDNFVVWCEMLANQREIISPHESGYLAGLRASMKMEDKP